MKEELKKFIRSVIDGNFQAQTDNQEAEDATNYLIELLNKLNK